jgi:hypothetical protein
MQLSLFKTDQNTKQNNGSGFSDPSFVNNRAKPIHRWVPWIAGFSSDFVKEIIDQNLSKKSVVLDPFAGVGTTLVEAYLSGHNVIGFEINPYAALASRVKLTAPYMDADLLKNAVKLLRKFNTKALADGYVPKSKPPERFKTRVAFFSPRILHKVLIIQDFINTLEDKQMAEIFQIAFASTMVSYSNYSYEPSLGTRKAVGKDDIEDSSVIDKLQVKLEQIVQDIKHIGERLPAKKPRVQVVNDSFFICDNYVRAGQVDLCITSPPYLNNYHYIRNTRPQLYWLGLVDKPEDTQYLEQNNFGKFWQTVRELEDIPLSFPDPPSNLVDQLSQLRSIKQERGIYGGSGWANYAASYFNDCYRFANCIKYSLKHGAQAFVVVGNSILQGVMIPTDQYLGEIAERAGLRLVDIQIPRRTRVGNSIIQSEVRAEKAQDDHHLYESVVHLRKTR